MFGWIGLEKVGTGVALVFQVFQISLVARFPISFCLCIVVACVNAICTFDEVILQLNSRLSPVYS